MVAEKTFTALNLVLLHECSAIIKTHHFQKIPNLSHSKCQLITLST
jgi:hypothetical protein